MTNTNAKPCNWLGKDDFVFLDDRPWPYLVKMTSDGWWLYYWSEGSKNFVSLRKLTQGDVDRFRPSALPAEQADLYKPESAEWQLSEAILRAKKDAQP